MAADRGLTPTPHCGCRWELRLPTVNCNSESEFDAEVAEGAEKLREGRAWMEGNAWMGERWRKGCGVAAVPLVEESLGDGTH